MAWCFWAPVALSFVLYNNNKHYHSWEKCQHRFATQYFHPWCGRLIFVTLQLAQFLENMNFLLVFNKWMRRWTVIAQNRLKIRTEYKIKKYSKQSIKTSSRERSKKKTHKNDEPSERKQSENIKRRLPAHVIHYYSRKVRSKHNAKLKSIKSKPQLSQ